MIKAIFLLLASVLFLKGDLSQGLECYHCYSSVQANGRDSKFVPCNEYNLTLSNTWVCPSPKAHCIYEIVEVEATKTRQTWRTCSNGISDPCDPNALAPGMKMIKCSHCSTDRCNLEYKKNEENTNNTFTFNINANVNLYVRQL